MKKGLTIGVSGRRGAKNTEKIMEQACIFVELKELSFPLTCLQFLYVK